MPISDVIERSRSSMAKSVESVQSQLQKIRTGRASGAIVENIRIEYYGSPTPLGQVGAISTPDARTILIQPWDKSTLSAIERAILASDLGLNPNNDGSVIRVPIPPLTEERRKDLVKMCRKIGEEGKIATRNIRRDGIEALKIAEKKEHFSEDDRKRAEEEIQKLTDRYVKDIDSVLAKKEKEIMEE
ncbi:ribosome recycling factor [Ignavibacteria bacterium]|nr:ribosome recycling factor [Bacteroidota bacterium]MCZ2132555.1 ribosome recycling factor [Bacteroidota bacterium]